MKKDEKKILNADRQLWWIEMKTQKKGGIWRRVRLSRINKMIRNQSFLGSEDEMP